jgi:hypothetical protein
MSGRWGMVAVASLLLVVACVGALIAQSRSQGVDGYVGVWPRSISAQEPANFGLSSPAVVVVDIVPNGPA